jgi:hypothetical protein
MMVAMPQEVANISRSLAMIAIYVPMMDVPILLDAIIHPSAAMTMTYALLMTATQPVDVPIQGFHVTIVKLALLTLVIL